MTAIQRRSGHKKSPFSWNNPVMILVFVAMGFMGMSWHFFPDQVTQVEHELAREALAAEHQVEGWLQQAQANGGGVLPPLSTQDRAASDAASARMKAQSSKWVDGEKALKKKLKSLAGEQQQGNLLGVPVLTRWLGEDFPAWVTPDMDEKEWRDKVAAKYKEMREEEEEWKKEMQAIIDQRTGDIGITTER